MVSSLGSQLGSQQPRERSGARTGSRYAFQAHVSLLKMLELHQNDNDYRALFDHVDDLVVLSDSSDSPPLADFFQIKGKGSGAWKASELARPSGAAPRTTVGKMYRNTSLFGSGVGSCRFTTNAAFEFKLANGSNSSPDDWTIPFSTIGPIDQKVLRDGLDLDFPPPRPFDEAALFVFERTPVPLTGYDLFLKGKLVEVLAQAEDNGVTISGLYRILIEEIIKRANDATNCTDLQDVFRRKSLARGDIEQAIAAAQTRRGILDHWNIIDAELVAAGWSVNDRIRIKTGVVEYMQARAKGSALMQELAGIRAAAQTEAAALRGYGCILDGFAFLKSIVCLAQPLQCETWLAEAAYLVESFDAIYG